MSSSLFRVIEHTSPCQHIREYPRGTKRRQEDNLRIAIKQYTPRNASPTNPDAVTIIAAPSNGFPKECYEPLWDELLGLSAEHGFQIRSIWAAQMSHQGESGILNEDLQGDDPSWFDHSRDLLLMINQFREEMPRPIVGIGHSVGALQLLNLSILHPRLLSTLVLIEPMIQKEAPPGPNAGMLSTLRRDIWPTQAIAEAMLGRKEFFGSWEPRAFDKLIKHGLRKTPTPVFPDSKDEFTLTTTKHQEAWTFLRSNFEAQQIIGTDCTDRVERLISPDMNPRDLGAFTFHRAEPGIVQASLPFVRPPVLYLFAGESVLSRPQSQKNKMDMTGIGLGGSGGAKAGQVAKVVFPTAGHLLPFEEIADCATSVSTWLGERILQFKADEEYLGSHPSSKSERDMLVVSEKWKKMIRQPAGTQRPRREKL